ncbi:craniofacial development protein 1 [Quercus suber]|uniref:Craniofacial development protein 1 n=1 Tax=Quercus suber TaxID=58331 RepID=A0AAW0LT27_QUESU
MATTNGPDSSGILNEKDGISNEPKNETAPIPNSEAKHEETEIKARVDAMWEQMNKGTPNKTPNFFLNKPRSTVNKKSKNSSTITEVRDFAGQEIEVKKLVDADSKEASEKAKGAAPSAVDAVLEQIKKKQKLSVLDKSKKDWGEFKEEKGLEEELDAYKKSSNQYLEKVSFLQRTDYREFERERDARLAQQAKRRTDMREEP